MALDHKGIQEGIIQTINTLVGKDACPEHQKFTSPVIKARQQGTLPAYPLVVVDKFATEHYGISGTTDSYYNDAFYLVVETRYKLTYNITVYGSPDNDVQHIAQEIRDTMFREYGKDLISTNTSSGLLGITAPTFSYSKLSTDYEEVSRITLSLSATDVYVEDAIGCPASGEITRIIINGDVNDFNGDPVPLPVHTDTLP